MASRMALSQISGNQRRGKELSPDLRAQIVGARRIGASWAKISKEFNVPISTARYTWQQHQLRVQNTSQPRPGRPPVYTEQDKRAIINAVRRFPKLSYRRIREESGVNAHDNTIFHILQESGLQH
jgi:transposase-like protein